MVPVVVPKAQNLKLDLKDLTKKGVPRKKLIH